MKRKKLLSLPILLVFVLSALNANIASVSAVESPYIVVVPESTMDLIPGDNFTISIYTNYGENIMTEWDVTAYQFSLFYNPNVLNGVNVTNGDVIVDGPAGFTATPFNNEAGNLSIALGFYTGLGQVTGMYRWPGPFNGTLAYVTFTVMDYGASAINLGPQTKLIGWNFTEGKEYSIIAAETMPTHIQHGYFQNVETVTRDIAVTSVTLPTSVYVGELVDIAVVVENQGDVNENFDVTAYNGADVIGTKTVTNLIPGATKSLTFTWNTAGVPEGTYTISATASTVPDETDTTDNTGETVVEVIEPQFPPVAVIVARSASDVYEEETFDGTGSYDLDGGTIIAYEWDFDDGETDTGEVVTHTYTTEGIYTVTLRVTDSQNQVGIATHTIFIEGLPPPYAAGLVRWKAKPEANHWDESLDADKNVTLTALAGNLGTNCINATITFAILDARSGTPIDPVIVEDVTLDVGAIEAIEVEIYPYDYGYNGVDKKVLYGQVTLTYDSDGDGIPDADATPKIFRFSISP